MHTKLTEEPTVSPESGTARFTEFEGWKAVDVTGIGVAEAAGVTVEPGVDGVGVGEFTVTWPVAKDMDADWVSYWLLLQDTVAVIPVGVDWNVLVYLYLSEL